MTYPQAYIIDLDYTLLDTSKLINAMEKSVKDYIPYFNFATDYNKIRGDIDHGYTYTVKLHAKLSAKRLNKNQKLIEKQLLKGVTQSEKFLYKNAIKLLEYIQNSEAQKILLTRGQEEFQKVKIKNLKLKKYFNKILITQIAKEKVKLGYKKTDFLIFINDNLIEMSRLSAKYPKSKFILLNSKKKPKVKNFIYCQNLSEVIDQLKKIK